MKISEIFESIQGEGINAGKPSIFIRTALCNLSCSWCDTKYTWDWNNYDYDKEVHEMSIESIKQKTLEFDSTNIVITGGEPLLQQDELFELLSSLEKKYLIEVETNGTILPSKKIISMVDQWNISPKTSNSNNIIEKCEIESCYRFFQKLPNSIFKFVVENQNDISEILQIAEKYRIEKDQIMVMPQASTRNDLVSAESRIKDLTQNNGFRYTSRLHVMKWGNVRGK